MVKPIKTIGKFIGKLISKTVKYTLLPLLCAGSVVLAPLTIVLLTYLDDNDAFKWYHRAFIAPILCFCHFFDLKC